MGDKTWLVSHRRARAPLEVRGKTLAQALKKEGLDPALWKPIEAPPPAPEAEGAEIDET